MIRSAAFGPTPGIWSSCPALAVLRFSTPLITLLLAFFGAACATSAPIRVRPTAAAASVVMSRFISVSSHRLRGNERRTCRLLAPVVVHVLRVVVVRLLMLRCALADVQLPVHRQHVERQVHRVVGLNERHSRANPDGLTRLRGANREHRIPLAWYQDFPPCFRAASIGGVGEGSSPRVRTAAADQ